MSLCSVGIRDWRFAVMCSNGSVSVGLASSNIVVSSALTKTVADQDTGKQER